MSTEQAVFASIEEALDDIRRGRMVVVCDDENRENEGDLTMAAQFATPDAINFMAKEGRGLICLTLTPEKCDELGVTRFGLPARLARYVVEKGSIAVDGVSLTVSAIDDDSFSVSLIPETLERTTLGSAAVGRPVNLEVDVLAKYVEKLVVR